MLILEEDQQLQIVKKNGRKKTAVNVKAVPFSENQTALLSSK
jgi:hypothetical protein